MAATTRPQATGRDLDQAYAALGAYVAERAIGVEGPIREFYLVTPFETKQITELRTEVGWPVFLTGWWTRGIADRPVVRKNSANTFYVHAKPIPSKMSVGFVLWELGSTNP